MRIAKLPIPLLIAAAALVSVAMIYVYVLAPPLPIHTDPNFTYTLYTGGVYLWRGAAFQYIFSADGVISLTYRPPYYLLITNGPLGNFSLGTDIVVIYVIGERPLMAVRQYVWAPWGGYPGTWNYEWLLYKLEDVTPPNLSDPRLKVWLPTLFKSGEVLSQKEYEAATKLVRGFINRVISIDVNATHIIFRVATHNNPYPEYRLVGTLPSPMQGKTLSVTNNPVSGSYVLNGTTLSAIALPYHYFVISPIDTVSLVIYVS